MYAKPFGGEQTIKGPNHGNLYIVAKP